MQRLIINAVVVGLVAGLLVGGFDNLFTVPVLERAIVLEEERAATESGGLTAEEEGGTPVSLGMQRIGLIIGDGIRGAIWGLVFAAGFTLLSRAVPNWSPLALSLVVGALGFWAISLFPFIKYPLNPPGVGAEATLLSRQLFQYLLIALSGAGVAGLLIGAQKINAVAIEISKRAQLYALLLLAYGAFAVIVMFAIPGNPDPVPVPIDLLELFRTLTMIGQFLTWALLAGGVALALMWQDRSLHAGVIDRVSTVGGPGQVR